MRRIASAALCALTVVACTPAEGEHDPIPEPSSQRELVIEQRTLPQDTTLTAVGLRPNDSERADERWDHRCDYSRPISAEDAWKQRFRVTIRNVSRDALEFEIVISQYPAEGDSPPKKRDLGRVVVPPLTEKRLSGFMLNPRKPGDKLCEVTLVER